MKKNFLLLAGLLCSTGGAGTLSAENVYTIYPVPQEQTAVAGTVALAGRVNVVLESGIDEATKARVQSVLAEHGLEAVFSEAPDAGTANVYVGINGSGEAADAKAEALGLKRDVFSLSGKFDRHLVSLTSEDGKAVLVILGENTDAAFYGLASLEQMLDAGLTNMPCVAIYDYADQKSRGLVEGYYGYPYTVSVKKDLMRFMMRYKMNTYMYGAKSDPYHSQYWSSPYPTSLTEEQEKNGWLSQDMIHEITEVSHQTKVNFIWAIHPGVSFINSSTAISDIMQKYSSMYDLGVRQFGVFVDDVGVPGTEAEMAKNADRLIELQNALDEKYNVSYASPADTVKPLHFVPHIYAVNFAGADDRRTYFNELSRVPEKVTVYITGGGVWSVPNSNDLQTIKNDFGRDLAWWWNYPCNDNADGQIYPMDMYSNFYDMPAVDNSATVPANLQNCLGVVSNPMQQGEVSKIPLFSVADYAWNNDAYNNTQSWNAAFPAIVGKDKADAYKALAYYLRYNDPASLNALINSYKASLEAGNPDPAALKEAMAQVIGNCEVLEGLKESETESDRLLYADLSPWLLKLKAMAESVVQLVDVAAQPAGDGDAWNAYLPAMKKVNGLSTEEAYKAYALEGMGTGISVSVRPSQPSELYLLPFVNYMNENALSNYFPENNVSDRPALVSNVAGVRGTALTNKNTVYLMVTQAVVLNKGEYVGISLPAAQKLEAVAIADTLAANYSVVYSTNGKTWKRFAGTAAVPDDFVKYVMVVNDSETPRSLRLSRNALSITLPAETEISSASMPSGNVYAGNGASNMTDGDYATSAILNRNQQNGDAYVVTLSEAQPIEDVRVWLETTNGDYMNGARVQVSADGQNWQNLNVKGTLVNNFTVSLPQVVSYADNIVYCDFDGNGAEARYVRLYVDNANTSKWIRIAEIEVNKYSYLENMQPVCSDGSGNTVAVLTDRTGNTGLSDEASALVYNFQQLQLLKSVVIYQDASALAAGGEAPKAYLSENGVDWTEAGTLDENVKTIDLAAMPEAVAMKIEWSGSTPAIYEIVEVADEEKTPVVTKIEAVAASGAGISLDFGKGALALQSPSGISSVAVYGMDGRLLLSQRASGQQQLTVPVLAAASGVLLVKAMTADGQEQAYKVYVK